MGKKLLLLGGGGHCRSVIDCLRVTNEYDEIGIVDYDISIMNLGVPVVGSDSDLPTLREKGWTDAFITVGSIGSTKLRRKLYQMVKGLGFSIPNIVDNSAVLASSIVLGEGVFIAKRAVINTASIIGDCSIINTGAIIEHDCTIGDFVHISSGTTLCGHVNVGNDTHVGAGSVVIQETAIGHDVLIGAGSVVVNDLPYSVKAYGNPCKVVK